MNNLLEKTETVEDVSISTINSRKGGGGGANLAKMLFGTMCVLILVLGTYYGYKFLSPAKVEKESDSLAPSAKKASVTSARTNLGQGVIPTVPPKVENQAANAQGCATTELLGSDGKPLIAPNGQTLKVDCKGKAVGVGQFGANGQVPAVDPSKNPQAAQAQNNNSQPPVKPVDRFAGNPFGSMSNGVAAGQGQATGRPQQTQAVGVQGRTVPPVASIFANSSNAGTPNQQGGVGALLNGTDVARVTATKLSSTSLMLPQGTLIPCTLTTKVVSEVSGFATCVLSQNVYSADGKTVLFDRGSTAMGEYVAGIQQGTRFLHVLWTRIRTPHNIVVNIASPSASSLGTIGLEGFVDNRWFDRLGAALLLSLIQDGINYGFSVLDTPRGAEYIKGEQETTTVTRQSTTVVNKDGGSSTSERTTTSAPSAGVVIPAQAQTASTAAAKSKDATGQMAEKVLASTINIKPVIYKNQGDRITIFVARDVSFDGVYSLTNK